MSNCNFYFQKPPITRKFCLENFKNFIEINLFERSDIVSLYKTNKSSDEKYMELKLNFKENLEDPNTCLFIDEIQECEELIQELKYFNEKHSNVRIITAGSLLGVKVGRMHKSFPVGKVKLLNMYPMNFEEFLMALGYDNLISEMRKCFKENKKMFETIHEKLIRLYKSYQIVGGMPKNVLSFKEANEDFNKVDNSILDDIKEEYYNDFKKHIDNKSESLKIEQVYRSIPSQLANESNKFQYSKIKSGGRAEEFETSIDWLVNANLIHTSYRVTRPVVPLEGFKDVNTFKLFYSDLGILTRTLNLRPFDILNDQIALYKGSIAENYVANEFTFKGINLYYWQSNGKAEVDFLLQTKDGVIPVEVKAGDNTQSKSLKRYIELFNPKYSIRISTKNFGLINGIKSIPLYAVFCLEKDM